MVTSDPRSVKLRALVIFSSALALVALGCGGGKGRAKSGLAKYGPIEAQWSGGRDAARLFTREFVVVRMNGKLSTYAIDSYDNGFEESTPIGFIEPERCVVIVQGDAYRLWSAGHGRKKIVNVGRLTHEPTDCSEYRGTPAARLVSPLVAKSPSATD